MKRTDQNIFFGIFYFNQPPKRRYMTRVVVHRVKPTLALSVRIAFSNAQKDSYSWNLVLELSFFLEKL